MVPNIDPVAIADSSTTVTVVPSCINRYLPTWYAEPWTICTLKYAERYSACTNVVILVADIDETDVSISVPPPSPPHALFPYPS